MLDPLSFEIYFDMYLLPVKCCRRCSKSINRGLYLQRHEFWYIYVQPAPIHRLVFIQGIALRKHSVFQVGAWRIILFLTCKYTESGRAGARGWCPQVNSWAGETYVTSDTMGSPPPPPPLNRDTRPKTLKLVATSFVILHTGIFSTASQEAIQKKHPIEPTLLTWWGGGGLARASLISPKKRWKLCRQWESDTDLYFRIQPSSKTKQAAMVDQWCVWRPIMAMLL